MARLFPFRSEPPPQDGQPRVVDLEGDDADAVFGALSSTTAREIYVRLADEPGTPSDVAEAIDSSIQNVRYHLEKLENAGLVEVVDTWYSSRGNEMSVYAATDGPLIVTSDESTGSQVKAALSRLLGGIGALAGGSLLVQYGLTRQFGLDATGSPAADETAPTGTAEPDGERDRQEAADDAKSDDDSTARDDEPDAESDDEDLSGDHEDDSTAETAEEEGVEEASGDELAEETDTDAEDRSDDTIEDDTVENATGGAEGTDGGVETADTVFATVPPGLLFFLGGFVVLLAVTIYWYWYRSTY